MDDRNNIIKSYVHDKVSFLRSNGMPVNSHQVDNLLSRYKDSVLSLEEIKREIDELVEEYIDNMSKVKKAMQEKRLEDLPLDFNGITINNQDIDLMNIMSAESIEELQIAIDNASNIDLVLDSNKSLEELKEEIFIKYQESLSSKEELAHDKELSTKKKVMYLMNSDKITPKEKEIIKEIVFSEGTTEEKLKRINASFEEDRLHMIYTVLKECEPIEKSGIKNTTPEATKNLIEAIKKDYNSLTIDQEAKYGSVALEDGNFDFRRLQKALDFAREMGKEVRLNALIFYMDCPKELYDLEPNEENKKNVKEKLRTYVDSTTKYIRDNNQTDIVRSIDVFNELLNRFAMDGDTPYEYRGDIEQIPSVDGTVPDNIHAGWLKHLNIEDLCEVIEVARKNLPNVDFMYNDDNFEDPKKMEATIEIFKRIRAYEEEHGVKLVDSIGTQMHIDNGVTKEDLERTLRDLAKLGLPIEITELDIAMTKGVEGLSEREIEILRRKKISEISNCITELKDECNIRGCTIWSKTDEQNFMLTLINEGRIAEGKEPIKTIHGGYYTKEMLPKGRNYNYHTHTKRCGHAGDFDDQEYIEAARAVGIKNIGFSDHVPFTEIETPRRKNRMDISQVDEYIESINKLKQENPDMTILCGFEAEYDPAKIGFLKELRTKVDYLILGQHMVINGALGKSKDNNNPNYPIEYADSVVAGIRTGLFDIVAHPDIFMSKLKTIETEEGRKEFLEKSKEASRRICEAAKEMGIPVELNLAGVKKKDGYPDPTFWEIASEVGTKVVVGADAHNPSQIINMEKDREEALDIIGNPKLDEVGLDYNPKTERKRNKKLQEALEKQESIPYATSLVVQVLSTVSPEKVPELIRKKVKDQSSEILGKDNKEELESFKKKAIELLKEAKEIETAIASGCKDKEAVITFIKNRANIDKSKESTFAISVESPKEKNSDISEMLKEEKQDTPKEQSIDKPKVLRLDINKNNSSNDNKGYTEILSLPTMMMLIMSIMILLIIITTIK